MWAVAQASKSCLLPMFRPHSSSSLVRLALFIFLSITILCYLKSISTSTTRILMEILLQVGPIIQR